MEFSKYFDHTLLKSNATRADIDRLCEEAKTYGFYSVCVNPLWVNTVKESLVGTDVKITSVVDFPFGASSPSVVVREALQALCDGADEIDMVANAGLLLSGTEAELNRYIVSIMLVYDMVHNIFENKVLKVILESELLNEEQLRKACQICKKVGVDFVKTSTGFAPCEHRGATINAVRIMKEEVGDSCKVKASGGIKTLEDANMFIEAGAERLGCSNSVAIMKEFYKRCN